MPLIEFAKNKFILQVSNNIDDYYKAYVARELKKKYGYGIFEKADKVFDILKSIYNLYCSEFDKLIKNESSYSLYEQLFVMLEDATYETNEEEKSLKENPIISHYAPNFNLSLYHRALMLILENAVTLELIFDKHLKTKEYVKNYWKRAEVLVCLATNLYNTSFDLSQFKLLNNLYKITLDAQNSYKLAFKEKRTEPELKLISKDINKQAEHIKEFDNDLHDKSFNSAIIDIFGIQQANIIEPAYLARIESEYDNNINLASLFIFEKYKEYLSSKSNISKKQAEKFLKGLILTKENKRPFDKVIKSPNINERLLYRPFLEVKIKDKQEKQLLSGARTIKMAIDLLSKNSFTWKVYPKEWECSELKKLLKKIDEKRYKTLENQFEKIIENYGLFYLNNVKNLIDENGNKHSIEVEECGEVDFIFFNKHKLYIADAKCLRVRSDPNGYLAIKQKFKSNKSKKDYERQLSKKIKYLSENRNFLKNTFQNKYPKDLDVSIFDKIEIEGVFLLNYPTLYGYYSPFKMYSSYSFEKFLKGENPFPEVVLKIYEEDSIYWYNLEYPFLQPIKAEERRKYNMSLL